LRRQYKYKEAFTGGSYYTDIPQRKVVQGLSGMALSQANIDKSLILREILAGKDFTGNFRLLFGEMQYAFISFVMGENLDSYEQWKRLLNLLCNCE